jgi:hypothetical protein
MSPEDHAYIAEHSKRGQFEMAMGFPNRYEAVDCYLVGAIAVHRDKATREWNLSHAATGMGLPSMFGATLVEAIRVARSIDAVVDWSGVKRGKVIGSPTGLTNAKKTAIQAMAMSFRHIAKRRAGSVPA